MADQKLLGYVETDSNSLFIVDGVWRESLPTTFQKTVLLEDAVLDEKKNVLPVYLFKQNNKRFLLIALDAGIPATEQILEVEVEDPVKLPEPPPPPKVESEEDDEEDVDEEEEENE